MSNMKIVCDAAGLPDLQKSAPPLQGMPIQKVGINEVRIPVRYKRREGGVELHDTVASAYVSLSGDKKGINMSRLTIAFHKHLDSDLAGADYLKQVLQDIRYEMRDSEDEPPLDNAYVKLKFKYHMKQNSLKSGYTGYIYYDCELEGVHRNGKDQLFLTVHYVYSSTCPCSKALAEAYMEEYKAGKTTEGNGTACAHAQRSTVKLTVELDFDNPLFIEDLVEICRKAIPTEVQVIVKRVDEQAFAILNGQYPIFCEDAVRLIVDSIHNHPGILDYVVVAQHHEALHPSDAVAVLYRGNPGGLR